MLQLIHDPERRIRAFSRYLRVRCGDVVPAIRRIMRVSPGFAVSADIQHVKRWPARIRCALFGWILLVGSSPANADFPGTARPLLQEHCFACHGPDRQEGELRFDQLTGNATGTAVWSLILEQLTKGSMPPKKRRRMSNAEVSTLTAWIEKNVARAHELLVRKMARPENGNLVPHDKLFDPEIAKQSPEIAASPARLWRMLPVSYVDKQRAWLKSHGAVATRRERTDNTLPAPFGLHSEHELKNYSFLYTLEGTQTAGLTNNARLLLIRVVNGNPKDERSLIRKLALAKDPPGNEDLDQVIADLYRYWLGRLPDDEELAAKRSAVLRRIETLGNRDGLIQGLVPIMTHPEAFFHAELGRSKSSDKPSLLSPGELIDAMDRAVRDRRGDDPKRHPARWQVRHGGPILRDFFVVAAEAGKLESREEVVATLQRAFAHKKMPKLSQSETVRRFLGEYFNYLHYSSVFKCLNDLQREKDAGRLFGTFEKRFNDGLGDNIGLNSRRVVDAILEEDKQVLARLLTVRTDYRGDSEATIEDIYETRKRRLESGIQHVERRLARTDEKKLPEKDRAKSLKDLAKRKKALAELVERHPDRLMPWRVGLLNQRSWLVSHSTNAENHAIHRGKWIRERLLGGRVPDVPITVDAALPEDPSKTLRERMQKTRDAECWKCHRLMDPLGLPFEKYDHFGSVRKTELDRPVVVTGEIIESGEPSLDGPVAGPEELVRKLAKSQRAQQVFVRYAFRFWMGRNETLDDARAVQEAWRAYKESDGSMSELLRSLLTSDAFLYRTGALTQGEPK